MLAVVPKQPSIQAPLGLNVAYNIFLTLPKVAQLTNIPLRDPALHISYTINCPSGGCSKRGRPRYSVYRMAFADKLVEELEAPLKQVPTRMFFL